MLRYPDETPVAGRRFDACCVVIAIYSTIFTAGLLSMYGAQAWGLTLGVGQRAAVITSIGFHGVGAVASLLLLVWIRRGGAVHLLAPKVTLSLMPILLLVRSMG